jgi:hypothetical protein
MVPDGAGAVFMEVSVVSMVLAGAGVEASAVFTEVLVASTVLDGAGVDLATLTSADFMDKVLLIIAITEVMPITRGLC